MQKLRAQYHKLAAPNVTIGRTRLELRPDIRKLSLSGLRHFLSYIEQRFEVVNILEGHRDIEFHFSQPDKQDKP